MDRARMRRFSVLFQVGGILFAFLFVSIILLLVGVYPFTTFKLLVEGAVGTATRISSVLVVWMPLLLVTSGLLVTFSTGL